MIIYYIFYDIIINMSLNIAIFIKINHRRRCRNCQLKVYVNI
ncbi:hypothetical protein CNEO2_390016 [Clostridium neonatale]|nr:hypothetical protein CNEO2_390016 [Clostridium neonatale]